MTKTTIHNKDIRDATILDADIARLHNWAAATAPTVNDDSGDGYSIGSRWLDTTADKEYVCLDATVGAAVWVETTATGGGGSDLVQTYSGGGSVYIPGLRGSPDILPTSPHADDDEFNAASTFGTVVGSLDTNNVSDFLSHLHLVKTTSAARIDGVYKACPATPFTITCKMSDYRFLLANQAAGIAIGDSTPTAWATYMPIFVTGNAVFNASKWTNATTRGTFTDVSLNGYNASAPIYLRMLVTSATSITCSFSRDGLVWIPTHTAFNPGLTPAKFGLVVSGFAAVTAAAAFDWVRVT